MTVDRRAVGWLSEKFHRNFRELLVHAGAKHQLAYPTYCLMPDHVHVVCCGLSAESDQATAIAFLRKHSNALLKPRRWQREAYDRVLREDERKQRAFDALCNYVLMNPVRAGVVEAWQDYPYSGAVVVGYPELHPRLSDYWERFWKVYARLIEAG